MYEPNEKFNKEIKSIKKQQQQPRNPKVEKYNN